MLALNGSPRWGLPSRPPALVTRGDAKIDYRRFARACERDNPNSRHLPSPPVTDNIAERGATISAMNGMGELLRFGQRGYVCQSGKTTLKFNGAIQTRESGKLFVPPQFS